MMELTAVVICIFLLLAAKTARAGIVTADKAKVFDREKAANGVGTLYGKYAFTRDEPPAEAAIKEIGILTLEPGYSIGYHKHTDNEDSYVIISGTGTYRDNDGKDYPVGPGDMTFVRAGQSHGLTNTGTVPLVFVGIIAAK